MGNVSVIGEVYGERQCEVVKVQGSQLRTDTGVLHHIGGSGENSCMGAQKFLVTPLILTYPCTNRLD